LDDAFARDLGAEVDDLNELKAKVRETIEKEEEKRTSRDLRRRLVEKIISGVDIALPETFVTSELEFAVQNVKQNLMRSGSDLTKAGLSEEKLREDFRPTCERRVKEMLSLAQIAEQEGLLVGEEDLEKAFEDMATETGQEASALRKYYEARDLLDSLRQKLLEEKTLNYLAEHAKISYVERKETEQENG
jgi:trigger factor